MVKPLLILALILLMVSEDSPLRVMVFLIKVFMNICIVVYCSLCSCFSDEHVLDQSGNNPRVLDSFERAPVIIGLIPSKVILKKYEGQKRNFAPKTYLSDVLVRQAHVTEREN